jgi:hypothetical protein
MKPTFGISLRRTIIPDNIKVLNNTSTSFAGGLAKVEGSEKDQVLGLELSEMFLL